MREYLNWLTQTPLFRGVAAEDILPTLHCLGAGVRRFPKGDTILGAGAAATHMGMVLEGLVQVSREDADGNRLVLAAIGPGELFAEAYACAGAESLPVTVTAMADCAVLLLDRGRILAPCSAVCTFHTRLIANLMEILARKNILLSQKLHHLSRRTLREKLLSYLGELATIQGSRTVTLPFDRQTLADYLCADRSALSREVGKLRQEGVLTTQRRQFVLLTGKEDLL